MMRMNEFALRRPVLFSVAVTVAFILALVLPSLALKSQSEEVIEATGAMLRIVIAAAALSLAASLGWRVPAGFGAPNRLQPWILIVPPLLYLGIVYPLLFTGSIAPNLHDPRLAAVVAADAFTAGGMEETVFRGLIFYALVRAWGNARSAVLRAAVVSSVLFSLPHLTNIFFGHQLLRVLAQIAWAFILGMAFALFAYAGASIWPVAFLHGALDAVVATNRIGKQIVLAPAKAIVMIIASVPVLVYAIVMMRKRPA